VCVVSCDLAELDDGQRLGDVLLDSNSAPPPGPAGSRRPACLLGHMRAHACVDTVWCQSLRQRRPSVVDAPPCALGTDAGRASRHHHASHPRGSRRNHPEQQQQGQRCGRRAVSAAALLPLLSTIGSSS